MKKPDSSILYCKSFNSNGKEDICSQAETNMPSDNNTGLWIGKYCHIIPFFSVCVEQEDFLTIQSNRYIMPTGSHSVALK
jgi:hypothetical protein